MSFLKRLLFKAEKEQPKTLLWSLPEYYGRWGEPREENIREFVDLAMGDPHVRMCVETIASAVVANGYTVQGEESAKNRVEEYIGSREHDFLELVKRIATSLAIFDEAFLEAHEGVDFPRLVAPWTIMVRRDNYGNILGYTQVVRGIVELKPEEIVHIKANAWLDFAYAVPRLKTLYRTLLTKREAEVFYYNVLMRKGVLAKVFLYKGGDAATFNIGRQELEQTKPGSTLLMMGDWEIKDLGSPVKELELPSLIDNLTQTIISLFGVPRIVLGYTEAATLETSRNQIVVFQQKIRDLQNVIAAGLTEAFSRILKTDGFYITLNPWTNPEQQIRIAVTQLQAGIITINEARAMLGLSPIEIDYAQIPLPPGTGGALQFDVQEALARIDALLRESRRAFPEKGLMYPAWIEDVDYVTLMIVEPAKIDLATIRYLTIDSEREIVMGVANVIGDEPHIMRRPVFIRFARRHWTLDSAKHWYNVVFPKYIIRGEIRIDVDGDSASGG